MIFYTLKDLTERLKYNGLPFSRPFINMLEKNKVIPPPNHSVHFRVKDASEISLSEMRIYTENEIKDIINKVRKYKQELIQARKKKK